MTEENEAILELERARTRLLETAHMDSNRNNAFNCAIKALEEIQKYRKIGTVEEFRAAVEQEAKIVNDTYKADTPATIAAFGGDAVFGFCPVCGKGQSDVWNHKYCGVCGQKLDWRDEVDWSGEE